MNKKILLLSFFSPLETNNGAGLRSGSLLKNLDELGYEIDIFYFSNKPLQYNEELANQFNNINRTKFIEKHTGNKIIAYIKSLYYLKPIAVTLHIGEKERKEFDDFISEIKYDVIIVDYLYMYEFIEQYNYEFILYEHNAEYQLISEIANYQSSFLSKMMKKIASFLTYKFENKAISKAYKVIHTTKEDINKFSPKYQTKSSVIPNTIINQIHYIDTHSFEKNILFIGDLAHYPNEEGILWFIENIWIDYYKLNQNISLKIVGKNANDKINSYNNKYNIKVLGFVDSLFETFKTSTLSIVPINIGSGSRLKILDSMMHSRLCLSSKLGAEGIDGIEDKKNIVISNNIEEWHKNLDFYLNNEDVRQIIEKKAYEFVCENYLYSSIKTNIKTMVEKKLD